MYISSLDYRPIRFSCSPALRFPIFSLVEWLSSLFPIHNWLHEKFFFVNLCDIVLWMKLWYRTGNSEADVGDPRCAPWSSSSSPKQNHYEQQEWNTKIIKQHHPARQWTRERCSFIKVIRFYIQICSAHNIRRWCLPAVDVVVVAVDVAWLLFLLTIMISARVRVLSECK